MEQFGFVMHCYIQKMQMNWQKKSADPDQIAPYRSSLIWSALFCSDLSIILRIFMDIQNVNRTALYSGKRILRPHAGAM